MSNQPLHPITTPKGTGTLTIILAVVGVFTPFFTGIETAQMFATVAVVVILWLYWADMRDVLIGNGGVARLAGPTIAILIIVSVAGAATWKISVQAKPPPPSQPVVSASDVSVMVTEALKREPPKSMPQPPLVETRIIVDREPQVIQSPTTAASESQKQGATATFSPEFEQTIARIKRDTLARKAAAPCFNLMYKLSGGLARLIAEAATKQNVYYDAHNGRVMVKAYEDWLPRARKYLEENKGSLPDTSAFELANIGDIDTGILPKPGLKAWAMMDAKRKALESIRTAVENRPCDEIGKAAVADCIGNNMC